MAANREQPEKAPGGTYVFDAESGAEMARLMRQDQLMTKGMGGIFPENINLEGVHNILDLACGPGGWVIETAFAYPKMQVVGVDISEKMIAYAQAQTSVQYLPNASFHVMNILQPLAFPDASFDLVNERFIMGFMQRQRWPLLIQESLRILRPGGTLRFTEIEFGYSNKPFFEKTWWLLLQAFSKNGLGFSPHGLHLSVIPMIPKFSRDAGLENIEKMAHVLEISAGTEANEGFYHDFANAFLGLEPFIEKSGVATLEEWRTTTQKGLTEMLEDDFCSVLILMTTWGQKPMTLQ